MMNNDLADAPTANPATTARPTSTGSPPLLVRHFRQMLMWPLRIVPGQLEASHVPRHWDVLESMADDCLWREVRDEFADPKSFQQRHYNEFMTFLPFVQRFL